MSYTHVMEAEGHLIDSGLMAKIMDTIILNGGEFQILNFDIGRTNKDFSRLRIKVTAPTKECFEIINNSLLLLGCFSTGMKPITTKAAPNDGSVPPDFYSTSNHTTEVFFDGEWHTVRNQRMDTPIVIKEGQAYCTLLRNIKKGDPVVCGSDGVRIKPEFKDRDRGEFSFMSNEISSERKVEIAVRELAKMMKHIKSRNGKIVIVGGPVVVHTGGVESLSLLIREGYVDALLGGNAIAVHDLENALFGTSLGVNLATGKPVDAGHRNHMAAINAVNSIGGIKSAVETGMIKSGIMYECVINEVPFILAGSLRDDGPLSETIMDLIEAQKAYAEKLKDTELVIMLATMLHSIAAGNMLPASVKTVCVDINPAVVTKLSDRGSSQARGIVTDVGLFLHLLAREIKEQSGLNTGRKNGKQRNPSLTHVSKTGIV